MQTLLCYLGVLRVASNARQVTKSLAGEVGFPFGGLIFGFKEEGLTCASGFLMTVLN